MADSDGDTSQKKKTWDEEVNEKFWNAVVGEERLNRWEKSATDAFERWRAGESEEAESSGESSGESSNNSSGDSTGSGSNTTVTAEVQEAVAADAESESPPAGRAPEYVDIPGGVIRIYKDAEGRATHAVRDEIHSKDGETWHDAGKEVVVGERAVSDWLSKFNPQPAPADESEDTEAEAASDPSSTVEGDRAGTMPPDTELGLSGTGGVPVGWSETEGVVIPKDMGKESDNAFMRWLQKEVGDKAQPVADEYMNRIEEAAGGSGDAPPTSGPAAGTPGTSSGGGTTAADPMDPNPTNQVRQASSRDMFDLVGRSPSTGGAPGSSGSSGSSGSGSGSSGSDNGSSGSGGTGLGGTDTSGFDFSPRPGTTGDSGGGSGGTGDSGDGDTDGDTAGAAGAAGGTSGGGSSTGGAGAGASGSSGTAPSGTVTIDYDGVVVEDEEEVDTSATDTTTDDTTDDTDEEPGVSTSVDPMGGNYQASTEDLERAAEYQRWLQGGRTPIDPVDDGGYGEDRSSGERKPVPGVGQPGPDGPMATPEVDPDDLPASVDQGDVINPGPDGAALNPDGGPESDPLADAFGPGPIGGALPGSTETETETKELEPQVALVAEVNIVEAEEEPLPPGTMQMAYDPNSHQAQYNELQQEQAQEEDTVTNRYEWADKEESALAYPVTTETNRAAEQDDDDNDGRLFD